MPLPIPSDKNIYANEANWNFIKEHLESNLHPTKEIENFLKHGGFENIESRSIRDMQHSCADLAFANASKDFANYLLDKPPVFPPHIFTYFDFAYNVADTYNNGLEQEHITLQQFIDTAPKFLATAESRICEKLSKLPEIQNSHEKTIANDILEKGALIIDKLQHLLMQANSGYVNLKGSSLKSEPLEAMLQFYPKYIKIDAGPLTVDEVFSKEMMLQMLRLQGRVLTILGYPNSLKYFDLALGLHPNEALEKKIIEERIQMHEWIVTPINASRRSRGASLDEQPGSPSSQLAWLYKKVPTLTLSPTTEITKQTASPRAHKAPVKNTF